MNDPVHPSLDLLADHYAGLLSGEPAAQVEHHLRTCLQCRALGARLIEVESILADEGRATTPMPTTVADSLEKAIGRAARQRETGQVVSMQEHRVASGDEPRPSRRAWPLLAAAAAVVVVSAVGIDLVQDGSNDDSAGGSSAGDTLDRAEPEGAAEGPQDSNPADTPTSSPEVTGEVAASLDAASVRRYADLVADGSVKPVPVPAGCAAPPAGVTAAYRQGLVTYRNQRAVLSINESARQLTVYACDAADKVLYRHGY